MTSVPGRISFSQLAEPERTIIKDDRHNSLHYMRKTVARRSSIISRRTAEDAFSAFGIALQDRGGATCYASAVKRLRRLRRQGYEGSKHYDLCEHYELSRYIRVFKQEIAIQNRIFYQNNKYQGLPMPAQL